MTENLLYSSNFVFNQSYLNFVVKCNVTIHCASIKEKPALDRLMEKIAANFLLLSLRVMDDLMVSSSRRLGEETPGKWGIVFWLALLIIWNLLLISGDSDSVRGLEFLPQKGTHSFKKSVCNVKYLIKLDWWMVNLWQSIKTWYSHKPPRTSVCEFANILTSLWSKYITIKYNYNVRYLVFAFWCELCAWIQHILRCQYSKMHKMLKIFEANNALKELKSEKLKNKIENKLNLVHRYIMHRSIFFF